MTTKNHVDRRKVITSNAATPKMRQTVFPFLKVTAQYRSTLTENVLKCFDFNCVARQTHTNI